MYDRILVTTFDGKNFDNNVWKSLKMVIIMMIMMVKNNFDDKNLEFATSDNKHFGTSKHDRVHAGDNKKILLRDNKKILITILIKILVIILITILKISNFGGNNYLWQHKILWIFSTSKKFW